LRLKILKKLRTASLNSEFTGSYKKNVPKNRKKTKIFHLVMTSMTMLITPSNQNPSNFVVSQTSKPKSA